MLFYISVTYRNMLLVERDFVERYGISVSKMTTDMFPLS